MPQEEVRGFPTERRFGWKEPTPQEGLVGRQVGGDRQATGLGRLVHTGKDSKGGLGGLDFILNVIKTSDALFHR